MSKVIEDHHANRLAAAYMRQSQFIKSTRQLATYLAAEARDPIMVPVASIDALQQEHDITIERETRDERILKQICTNATQSNLAKVSVLFQGQKLKMQSNQSANNPHRFYLHVLKLEELPGAYRTQLLAESLKILKYFSHQSSPHQQPYFLKVLDIFLLNQEQQVFVCQEFTRENTLQHLVWENAWNGYYNLHQDVATIKKWTIQLATAIEKLNQAGVVHRFIRPENVLLCPSGDRQKLSPRLASFDFACTYWDVHAFAPKAIQPRALPLELPGHLLDHLPPECFLDGYDGTNVDVWSLGVLVMKLFTGHAPFEAPDLASDEPPKHLSAWRRSEQRRMIPDEISLLLDDVFKEADARITAFEMAEDLRLWDKKKYQPHYRIDVVKGININMPVSKAPSKLASRDIPAFPEDAQKIYNLGAYKEIASEADLTGYRILRGDSIMELNNIVDDNYLKAAIDGQEGRCLAKIIRRCHIPQAHRAQMSKESCPIMRYFSANEPLNSRVHRVLDIYLCHSKHSERVWTEKLIIFYESLDGYQSLYQLVREASAGSTFPGPARGKTLLTMANIQVWIRDLAQTAEYLAHLGLAHRYIRPEYVFVNEANGQQTKLTHFDMACFAWSPIKRVFVLRSPGLQDKLEHLWDHLPPECFDAQYDSLQVDAWSIGVVLAFCLAGAKPFTTPMTMAQASEQWLNFKAAHPTVFSAAMSPVTQILEDTFVPTDKRPSTKWLLAKFSPENLQMDQLQVNLSSK